MGIFGDMMDKIRGKAARAEAAKAPPTGMAQPSSAAAAPAAAATAPASTSAFDVESNLEGMAKKSSQTLNWRTSIVDLMKLLDIDSSMVNRRALANELGYTGDLNDSATMNVWLHSAVMKKLAEHGGTVPASLLD